MKENQPTELRTGVLSLTDCIMIAIGGMVGSAIFSLSGLTYKLAGPVSLLAWIIAGLIVFLYALNVAELATSYPKSGGVFVYPYEVLGKTKEQKGFWGWVAAWSWIVVSIIGTAFSAIYVSTYLGSIIPAVADQQVLIAVLWILLCLVLNIVGISAMGKVNLVLTFILVAMCLIYVVVGFGNVDFANFTPFFGQGVLGDNGLMASIPIAMLAYGSIIAVASIAQEVKKPQKTIPKAISISLLATIVMYSLIIMVTIGLVNWQAFAQPGNEWAAFAPLSFATAVSLPHAGWLQIAISIGALLALTTTMMVLIMGAGRTIMVASQSKLLPGFLGKVGAKSKTPVNGLICTSLIAILLACFPDQTSVIVNIGAIASAITVFIIAVTLIVHRRKKVSAQGTFKVPGGLTLPVLTMVIILALLTLQKGEVWMVTAYAYGIGLLIYLLNRAFFKKTNQESEIKL